MNEAPEFVRLVREIVPKEGLKEYAAGRLKSKIRKKLMAAGYTLETIRGIGQRIGDYVIVYEEKDDVFTAQFQKYENLDIQPKKKRRAARSKASILFTGPSSEIKDMSLEDFTKAIVSQFPEDWQYQSPESYRWLATDITLLRDTSHTVETAAQHIQDQAKNLLPHLTEINYTVIPLNNDRYIIGIGPS